MNDNEDIEDRLRRALREVARQPTPEGAADLRGRRTWWSPTRLRSVRLLVTVGAVAAVGAAIGLAVAYAPSGGPPHHGNRPAAAERPTTSSFPTTTLAPPTTVPGSTTTTLNISPTTVPTAPTTTPPGTATMTYEPFVGGQIDPALHVTSHGSGPCFEYGGGADGRDYYRCGTSQPCFAGPQGTSAPLVCPAQQDPASGDVLEWTATSVDTSFTPATSKAPWAVQLSNGVVCSLVNAAWSGLGPFGCNVGDGQTPADCRMPQSGQPYWSTACQDQESQASPFTSMTVMTIWF